jgi:hypothetical protein
MSFILPTLRSAERERYHKAVHALNESTLRITVTRQTDNEIRALVQNGDGRQYGVTVNASVVTCSCFDALFRGTTCKHAIAVCIRALEQHATEDNHIHLLGHSGAVLCGSMTARRLWQRWPAHAANVPEVCQHCLHAWTRSATEVRHG